MKKIEVEKACPGMVIAADIFDQSLDAKFPLIGRGVKLTGQYIESLKTYCVPDLLIESPEGDRGAAGETLIRSAISEDILFDGGVEISGPIPPNIKIEAGEAITIEGEIAAGCVITSAKRGVLIKGALQGTAEARVRLAAAERVVIEAGERPISFIDVKTIGTVAITGTVSDSSISAKGAIKIAGRIAGQSTVYSQTKIRVEKCGDPLGRSQCQLLIKPHECRPLVQELLKTDATIAGLQKERESLRNVIDLIKKLDRKSVV